MIIGSGVLARPGWKAQKDSCMLPKSVEDKERRELESTDPM